MDQLVRNGSARGRIIGLLVFGVLALALAGCVGGDSDGPTSASSEEATTASTTSPIQGAERPAAGSEIGQDGDEPETVVVDAAERPGTGGDDDDRSTPAQTITTIDIEALEGAELNEFLASRYEAFWHAFGEARAAPSSQPAIDFPALADLAADEQLELANAELEDLAAGGQALRRPDVPAIAGLDQDSAHRIRVERVDDATADLEVCFVNDRISYQVDDGAVISDTVVTVTARATMARTDGTWKLIRSRAIALEPGVAGCWLEDESRYPW